MTFDTSQGSYQTLRSIISESTERIITWVGAGLSTTAGFPNWQTLRTKLEEALFDKAKFLETRESRKLENMGKTIQSMGDIWTAFEVLKENLGETTWNATIRETLGHAHTVPTPQIYKMIWNLKVQGVLNLNLDRLASKSYAETVSNSSLSEFSGKQAGNFAHLLNSPRQFICNLHGIVDDTSSWVLTKRELSNLLSNQAYKAFINACIISNTIIFTGISVDDIAVGGFLRTLVDAGIDFSSHYWITSRRDKEADEFAERSGVRLIRYDASAGNHSELLEIFTDLQSYVSPEDGDVDKPAFISTSESEEESIPNNTDILKLDTETIRKLLNNRAHQILSETSPEAYKEYEDFSKEYDEAIYRAWYTSVKTGSNRFCDYTLYSEKAQGAFGKIFHAHAQDGTEVALKVLHEEIRRNPELLHSFRRGVRSMSILSDAGVKGMVPYINASEIPAFVVMNWIQGTSLKDAVEARQISDWDIILRIATDVATIVREGHLLPERVLHRDLRPSNIMLKDFYTKPEDWEVVVLDFDLSWYRGSIEKSVVHGSTFAGYLAPEQIQSSKGVSTRHTSVDSFGLGMTLFFLCSGRDPIPNEQMHHGWEETVCKAVEEIPHCIWRSTPNRMSRLILKATRQNQKDRWDMAQIQGELTRLLDTIQNPSSVDYAELVAEEIAARCSFMSEYIWNDDIIAAVKETSAGVKLCVIGDESNRLIKIELSFGLPGVHGKGENVGKWIPERFESAVEILKKGGWTVEYADNKWANIRIEVTMDINKAVSSLDNVVEYIEQATDLLRF